MTQTTSTATEQMASVSYSDLQGAMQAVNAMVPTEKGTTIYVHTWQYQKPTINHRIFIDNKGVISIETEIESRSKEQPS
jgi:hypothetical protein